MKKITLVAYDLYVTTDILHGWGKTVFEFCSPELGLFVNEECVFVLDKKDTKHRLSEAKHSSKVELSKSMSVNLKALAEVIKNKDELSKRVQMELFKGLRIAKRLAGEK